MATTLKAYSDPTLTTELTLLSANQNADGSTGALDFLIYMGSVSVGKKLEADSNAGVDDIVLSISDSDAGTGSPATDIRLALTSLGLDSAIAGDPLTLGPVIYSEQAGAVPVYVRIEDSTNTVSTNTDLSLQTNILVETNV